ncbi:MAG TPA: pyridoxal phosphate-dependent aminotransferase [Thermodesulfobacteriota bacterium]|nr:pyridoxal phosphate-dependent aminotransferase [Thermodesulfobacteriota bacterium]
MRLAARAEKLKPSATLAITAKAKALKAQGIDVVGFGAGEPDFDTPDNIKDRAIKAIKEGFTKYTAVGGIDELKNAIIYRLKEDHALQYDKAEIIVSCGAKHTLYNLSQVLFEDGDEVIIPSPYWVSYPEQVSLAGGTPVIIETEEEAGFKIDPDKLKKLITPRTKALILNYPSNPTGATYNEEELKDIVNIAMNSGLIIISDEIYEKILYDGLTHTPVAKLGEEVKKSTILVNGVSKSYSMTGWRIGFAAGDKKIIGAMNNLQGQSTSNPVSISQIAAVEAFQGSQEEVKKMAMEFEKRKNYIVKRLSDIPGFKCFNPQGAFYVFPNISRFYRKKHNGKEIKNSVDFTEFLLEEAKVAVVPGIEFGSDNHIRISYATSMDEIKKGIDRVEKAVEKLK